ncbi:UPF0158 family protein [Polaribacter sp. Hel_I_88]|uniref:UPF0158 family protein n=1 Tax=Polaribacter sp. Hel_I_88 TaxID=1250006 RepID=UPI00047D9A68|nr:UPF0158 family protein [Polaribacter sp. Hel_I_88]
MENSKTNIIKEIASHLECGENCYYNPKTNELITIPQSLENDEDEEFMEFFQETINKIKNHKKDYIRIPVLESFESFKIMENFVDEISDKIFKNRLENMLQKRKPFRNFKDEVESSVYREAWFAFRQKEMEKIVEEILKIKENGNY